MVAFNRDWSASFFYNREFSCCCIDFLFSIEFNQAMMAMAEFGIL
jgi:hypothetical protein